ncbi:catalase [Spizellomyces sp. 'palustris']|nr:catalase [Spizellomyces sp. 'palustris']
MADLSSQGIGRSVANAAAHAVQGVKGALGVGMTAKRQQLNEIAVQDNANTTLTTSSGVPITTVDDSLKAGERGPTLIEDFQFRDRMAHFDRERIPERVVHARGSAAHGYFQVYESLSDLTRAAPFQDPSKKTPVFVRLSTVQGSKGSADTVRDVRGFATKFYTDEGNWDLVGNNIPVFFIQDAVKFPDLVHALKPEPHNEIPQGQTAHDNFWDFVSLLPESTHMLMWIMSDRTIPRSFRMINGFGVHTFRLVNANGVSRFVKFHWRPVLGVHSFIWDEALKTAGRDPDYLRRDLWMSIEMGDFPEWELGIQVIEESEADKLPFDILDATKYIPEEIVPIRYIGKMTLNRNPDEFFPETEQAVFHPGHLIPGIDVSEDPLLQGRLFSYTDTAFHRVGTNFNELPINRPVCPVHNHQRGGFMRHTIVKGQANYHPNSLGGGCPALASASNGYVHYPAPVSGRKTSNRPGSFSDHFSQARMFYNSMTETEKGHILGAFSFELSKVSTIGIRQRMVDVLNKVDHDLAVKLADNLGVKAPETSEVESSTKVLGVAQSPALSIIKSNKYDTIRGRMVGIYIMPGYDSTVSELMGALTAAGAVPLTLSAKGGPVPDASGSSTTTPSFTFSASSSTQFDALFIPGGRKSVDALLENVPALVQIAEGFKHLKAIAAVNEGVEVVQRLNLMVKTAEDNSVTVDYGVITAKGVGTGMNGKLGKAAGMAAGAVSGATSKASIQPGGNAGGTSEWITKFIETIAKHKVWDREELASKIVI